MIKYLLMGIFTVVTTGIFAQTTQTIKGQVIDKESKYQLIGVTVAVIDVDPVIGVTTNENGEYKLSDVPLGRHTMRVSYIGYKEQTIPNIMVTSGKEVVVNFQMEENIIQTDEVVVRAENDKTATNNEMAVISARSFNLEEAMRYAGSRNDPSRMAMNFAGVSGANDSRNDIIIRGNSPTGLLWRMEGIEIFNPNHFGLQGTTGGPVSMLNTNLLEKSDFLTGAFPANYGNATSGVFDLQMRRGNNEKREYLGQVGFNGFELGAEGPFSKNSKAAYLINYRYSTLGIFKALGIPFGAGQAVPQYQDITFKFDLPTTKAGRFSLFGMGGLSHVDLVNSKLDTTKKSVNFYGDPLRDSYFKSNMGIVGLSHLYFLNNSTYSKLVIAVSGTSNNYEQDSIRSSPQTPLREYDNYYLQQRTTFNYSINKKFNSKNTINTGFNIDRIGFEFNDNTIQGRPYGVLKKLRDDKGAVYLHQAWVQWSHRFTDRLSLNSGLHFQYFTLNRSTAVEPRLGARYRLTEKLALNFGAGVHNQMQPVLSYFVKTNLYDNTGRITAYNEMNRKLGFTTSNHLVLGYDYNFAPKWRLKMETYYQYLNNVPVKSHPSYYSMINYGSNYEPPQQDSLVNKGLGYNYGVETTIEKFFSNGFYMLGTASVYESKYRASDNVWRNTAFNGNFVLNLLIGYEVKVGKKGTFSIDSKTTYAGGRRYVPIDINATLAAKHIKRIESEAFENKYRNYFRQDLKIAYRIDGKKVSQQWSVMIDNLFNTKNIFMEQYNGRKNTIDEVNQLGLFIIPQYRVLF